MILNQLQILLYPQILVFDRGYSIYAAKEDYQPDDLLKLAFNKGDQIVVKEYLSEEMGIGVNLNSTEEGEVSLTKLDSLY